MSLLEKALAVENKHPGRVPSHEEMELALACLVGEVTDSQASKVLTKGSTNAAYRLWAIVKAAHRQGYIKINKK